ncbi:MAG: Do family serine endopeptidase [Thermoanaerobaculia bacterium]
MRPTPPLPRTLAALALLLLPACDPAGAGDAEPRTDDSATEAQEEEQRRPAEEGAPGPEAASALSRSFRSAAEEALPAVVFVQVEAEPRADSPQGPMPDPFRYFFGPEGPEEGPPQGQIPPRVSSGSGVIYDQSGLVVTNHHVVADASYVLVRLSDGREYQAEVVGSDPSSDLAVLQLDTEGQVGELPTAELGSSERLQVGDWVLALGSPFGLESTVTAGIVSAKGRQITGRQAALESFIQTDAAINMGNSGGPLVDLSGRVVGINTAIVGGPIFTGYGFAIPVDLARDVVSDLLEFGEVRRPLLGVRVSDVTAVDAEVYGLDEVRGADVASIDPDSPAAEAGLELGDVILAVDGEEIAGATELTTELAKHEPGERVELTIVRDGERRTVEAVLGRFETEQPTGGTRAQETATRALGFSVEPLTPAVAEQLGYEGPQGVVIRDVAPFSAAANAGVQQGQILLQVNGRDVQDPADLEVIAEDVERGDVVSLRLFTPDLGETLVNYRVR